MAFCEKCGTQLNEGARFCPSCGASVAGAEQQADSTQQQQQGQQQQGQQQQAASTPEQDRQRDIDENKVLAVFAYIIFLIPLLAAKDSPCARYHTNQGLVLFLFSVGYGIVCGILNSIFMFISLGLFMVMSTIFWILALGILALCIIGIVNVCKGEYKPLPIIGGITIIR